MANWRCLEVNTKGYFRLQICANITTLENFGHQKRGTFLPTHIKTFKTDKIGDYAGACGGETQCLLYNISLETCIDKTHSSTFLLFNK